MVIDDGVIVAGITTYSDIGTLDGTQRDAEEFC
jgi:hypothetical protein